MDKKGSQNLRAYSEPTVKSRHKEGFREKIKTFFHISKESEGYHTAGGASSYRNKAGSDYYLNNSTLIALRSDNDLSSRLKALKNLESVVASNRLEPGGVETLWMSIKDLLEPPKSQDNRVYLSASSNLVQQEVLAEARTQVLVFVIGLVQGQYQHLESMRSVFFQVARRHWTAFPEDRALVLELIQVVSQEGKDVKDFADEIGDLISTLSEDILSAECQSEVMLRDWLSFVKKVIHHNAAFLDEEHVASLVAHVCIRCCHSGFGDTELCLSVLDAVLRYSIMPQSVLLMVTTTMCKLVNVEYLCQQCWRFVRNILSSYLGYGTMYTLCNLLEASDSCPDPKVLRGAVFFIGMGLWGSKKVESLYYSPAAVLPSLKAALTSQSLIVTYEILLSLQRLVQKYGKDLQLITWHLLIDLLNACFIALVDLTNSSNFGAKDVSLSRVFIDSQRLFHEIITSIETLYESNDYGGSSEELFALIERCSKQRPENSIIHLLSYRAQSINPLQSDWVLLLKQLLEFYYKKESRCSIRIKALNVLRNVYTDQKYLYGIDVIQFVVLPLLQNLHKEKDAEVQETALNLLCDIAQSCTSFENLEKGSDNINFFDGIMNIFKVLINEELENMVNSHKNSAAGSEVDGKNEMLYQYLDNVEKAVCGLVEILKTNWLSYPPSRNFGLLNVLAEHVELQYRVGMNISLGASVRERILDVLLHLRVNPSTFQLGMQFSPSSSFTYSPYMYCSDHDSVNENSDLKQSSEEDDESLKEETFKWTSLATAVILCIQKERFWPVLRTALSKLSCFLRNRALVLSDSHCIQPLCNALVALTNDPHRVNQLIATPENFITSEISDWVCPPIAALISYKTDLDEMMKKKLVMAIQSCIVSERSVNAVIATIGCALELPSAVVPMARDIVKRMSQLPSVPKIMIPIMELVSTLYRLPSMYEHFTEKDFKHALDGLFHCANPWQFTTFIAAVAHHLIYRWFLKAPLVMRPSLAKYILSALDEISTKQNTAKKSSQTGMAEKGKEQAVFQQIHTEAYSVMVEFLKHYTYTNESSRLSKKDGIAELISKHGWSQSWLVADRLVTITTIVSETEPGQLCNKCLQWVESESSLSKLDNFVSPEESEFGSNRRRHQSAIQGRVTQNPPKSHTESKDDSYLCSEQHTGSISCLAAQKKTLSSVRFRECIKGGSSNCSSSNVSHLSLPLCGCWCCGYAALEIRHCFGRNFSLLRVDGPEVKPVGDHENAALYWALMRFGEMVTNNAHQEESVLKLKSKRVSGIQRNFSDTQLMVNIGEQDKKHHHVMPSNFGSRSEVGNIQVSRHSSMSTHLRQANRATELTEPLTVDTKTTFGLSDGMSDQLSVTPMSSASSNVYFSSKTEQLVKLDSDVNQEPKQKYQAQLNPSWIFSQLCYQGLEPVCCLPTSEADALERSLRNLDRITPFEPHKIGVIYAGPRQTTEIEMLANQCGSHRYDRFLEKLGHLVSLKNVDQTKVSLGGLDTSGKDGLFTYYWSDPITQVVFHVATLMPTRESDPQCKQKKLHIGNDFVTIVYNDSGREYKLGTVSGQFAYVAIVVEPMDCDTFSLKLLAKDEISRWLALKEAVLSDSEAPLVCRQMGMRADFSARVWQNEQNPNSLPYLSQAVERLRQIKHIRERFAAKSTNELVFG